MIKKISKTKKARSNRTAVQKSTKKLYGKPYYLTPSEAAKITSIKETSSGKIYGRVPSSVLPKEERHGVDINTGKKISSDSTYDVFVTKENGRWKTVEGNLHNADLKNLWGAYRPNERTLKNNEGKIETPNSNTLLEVKVTGLSKLPQKTLDEMWNLMYGTDFINGNNGRVYSAYDSNNPVYLLNFNNWWWLNGGREQWLKDADARAKALTPTLGTFATLAWKPIEAVLPSKLIGTIGKQVRDFDLKRLPSDWLGSGFGGGNLGVTEISDATADWAAKNPGANSTLNMLTDVGAGLLSGTTRAALNEGFSYITPSTYVTPAVESIGRGIGGNTGKALASNAAKIGAVTDLGTFGTLAYPSAKRAYENPTAANLIEFTGSSIPVVLTGFNAVKALNNGRIGVGNYRTDNGHISGVRVGNKAYGMGRSTNPYAPGIAEMEVPKPASGNIEGELKTGDLVRLENGNLAYISKVGNNSVTLTTRSGNKFSMSKAGASELKVDNPELEPGLVIIHMKQYGDNVDVEEFVYTGKKDNFGGILLLNKYGENLSVSYDDLNNGNFEVVKDTFGDIKLEPTELIAKAAKDFVQNDLPLIGLSIKQGFSNVGKSIKGIGKSFRRQRRVTLEEPTEPITEEPTIESTELPVAEATIELPVQEPVQEPINVPNLEPSLEIVQDNAPLQGRVIPEPVSEPIVESPTVDLVQQEINALKLQRADLVNARKSKRKEIFDNMDLDKNLEVKVIDEELHNNLKAEDKDLIQEISKINDRLELLGEERFGEDYNASIPDEQIPELYLPSLNTPTSSPVSEPVNNVPETTPVPEVLDNTTPTQINEGVESSLTPQLLPEFITTTDSNLQPVLESTLQPVTSTETPTVEYTLGTQSNLVVDMNSYPQYEFDGKIYYKIKETPEGHPVLLEKGTNNTMTRQKDIFKLRAIPLDNNGHANVDFNMEYTDENGVTFRPAAIGSDGTVSILNTKTGVETTDTGINFLKAKRLAEQSRALRESNSSLTNNNESISNEVNNGQLPAEGLNSNTSNNEVTNNLTPNELVVNNSSNDTEDLLASGIFKEGVLEGGNNSNINASRRMPKIFSPVYGKIRIGNTEYKVLGDNNGVLQLQDPKNGKVFSTTMEELLNGKKRVEVINTGFNLFSFGPGASSKFNVNGNYVYLPGTKFKDFGLFTGSYSPYRQFSFLLDVAKPFAKAFWLPTAAGGAYYFDQNYPGVLPHALKPWEWDFGFKLPGGISNEDNVLDNTTEADSAVVKNEVADTTDIGKIDDTPDTEDNVAKKPTTNPQETKEVTAGPNAAANNDDDDLGDDYTTPTKQPTLGTQNTGNTGLLDGFKRVSAKQDTLRALRQYPIYMENDSLSDEDKAVFYRIAQLTGNAKVAAIYDFIRNKNK